MHQGESIVSGKIAGVYLAPLLIMMLGYMLLFLSLWMLRIRTVILERRARTLMQRGALAMNFDLGPYGVYIWPAYGVSAVALIGITLWSLIGWYKAKAVLAKLEKK